MRRKINTVFLVIVVLMAVSTRISYAQVVLSRRPIKVVYGVDYNPKTYKSKVEINKLPGRKTSSNRPYPSFVEITPVRYMVNGEQMCGLAWVRKGGVKYFLFTGSEMQKVKKARRNVMTVITSIDGWNIAFRKSARGVYLMSDPTKGAINNAEFENVHFQLLAKDFHKIVNW